MWYNQPIRDWVDALPIGNGVLGAMVFGAPEKEHLSLNHEWLWRAKNRYRDWDTKHQHLAEVRKMFFAGKTEAAGELAKELLLGPADMPKRVDPFVPAGDLWLDFGHRDVPGFTSDYRRELDLKNALAKISYRYRGVQYTREIIAHSTLPIIAVHLTSSQPDNVTCSSAITRTGDPECRTIPSSTDSSLIMEGAFVEGSRFAVEARVIVDSGEIEAVPDFTLLQLEKCNKALVLLTIGVAHNGEDLRMLCNEQLDVPSEWSELLASHRQEHARMYSAVSLDFQNSENEKPTDERVEDVAKGANDNGLFALHFNFGRYLLISSSRKGGLPANLQGTWSDALRPPWESDFHHNVNIQMNYWPAEVCGLGELAEPLFDHVERLIPHGREMAQKLYGCEGVLLPLQTDPWGRATPESRQYALWTGAAAWLAQHFWWRYEFDCDKAFLRERAYPLLRDIAAFYETYLVRDPKGRLVPVPSQSPENTFVGGCTPISLCIAATLDLELIHDSLNHAIKASEILDCDEEKRNRWRRILEELAPVQIGRHGQLQEWFEDYEETNVGHLHFSPLFGLFPGDRITSEEKKELAAARVTFERRIRAGSRDVCGWTCGWAACLAARLQEGDIAYESLIALLAKHTSATLLSVFPLPPPYPTSVFQIDGNLGGTAAIAEMLLQSHRNRIHILPALPSVWPKGRVSGLRARGGYVVDIEWDDGRPETVTVYSKFEGLCTVQHGMDNAPKITCESKPIEITESDRGLVAFMCDAEKEHNLRW